MTGIVFGLLFILAAITTPWPTENTNTYTIF